MSKPEKNIDTKHHHDFKPTTDQKVLLRGKGMYDMLKRRKCSCGKIETYDLVRFP